MKTTQEPIRKAIKTLIKVNVLAALLLLFITFALVMLLWNLALVPAVGIAVPIGYWQAAGLTMLFRLFLPLKR